MYTFPPGLSNVIMPNSTQLKPFIYHYYFFNFSIQRKVRSDQRRLLNVSSSDRESLRGTPLNRLGRYVRRQRIYFLTPFGLKLDIHVVFSLGPGCGIGYVFLADATF